MQTGDSVKIENSIRDKLKASFTIKRKKNFGNTTCELKEFLTEFNRNKQKHLVFDEFQKNCEKYGGLEFMVNIFSLKDQLTKFFKFATLGEMYSDAKVNIFDIETYDKNTEIKPEQRPINSDLSQIFEKEMNKVDFYSMAKKAVAHKPRKEASTEIEKVN